MVTGNNLVETSPRIEANDGDGNANCFLKYKICVGTLFEVIFIFLFLFLIFILEKQEKSIKINK